MPNSPKPGPEERSLLHRAPPHPVSNPRRATWATYFVRGFLLLFAVTFSARALWYGKPTAVNCGLTHTGQIDCTLTSQALLRSWKQHIPDVTTVEVDGRGYYVENEEQEKYYVDYYVVVLQAQDREYLVKTYSYRNVPELEVWRHRINQFTENPEEGLEVSVYYNSWQPILKVILVPFYIVLITITPLIIASLLGLLYFGLMVLAGQLTGFVKYRSLIDSTYHKIMKFIRSRLQLRSTNAYHFQQGQNKLICDAMARVIRIFRMKQN